MSTVSLLRKLEEPEHTPESTGGGEFERNQALRAEVLGLLRPHSGMS